jgi:Tfp pilus assembly protein PilV
MIARIRRSRRGVALILALGAVGAMILFIGALAGVARQARRGLDVDERRLQAAWLLQAGAERAALRLRLDPDYAGETWTLAAGRLGTRDAAEVVIAVEPAPDRPSERAARVVATLAPETARRTRVADTFPIQLDTNPALDDGDERP